MLRNHYNSKQHGAYSGAEAATYDADRETEALWHIENNYVRALVARTGAASVLDAPVGTGRFLTFYDNGTVTGVDLSGAMLKQSTNRISDANLTNVALLQGSVTCLPFGNNQFDLVISWRLFHLLPPDVISLVMAELARVCRGTLCIQTYERASFANRLAAKSWRWVRRFSLIFRAKRRLTPWSHIKSFNYSSADIELAASNAGIGEPICRDKLGYYEGTVVMARTWKFAP